MGVKNIFKDWIELDLRHLEEFEERLESLLSAELEEFSSWNRQEAEKLPKNQQDEFYDIYSDDFWLLSEEFPNIMRLSFFVHCYALLESRLQLLCKNLKVENKIEIGPSDLRDEGIRGSKTYLKKVIGIKFPDQTQTWQDILQYNFIRNCIVHEYGKVNIQSPKIQEFKSFMGKKSWIKLDKLDHIQLSENFHREVISTLRKFIKELVEVI